MPTPANDPVLGHALEILRERLVRLKGRADVEVLRVAGVRSGSADVGWLGTAPGLTFEVEYTYTQSRRVRRTAELSWPIWMYDAPSCTNRPGIPAALMDLLNQPFTTGGDHGASTRESLTAGRGPERR